MSDDTKNLTHRVAKGAGWMVIMRFCVRGIGLISTLILARLLVPDDFGVVAVAMLVFGIVEVMGQFGFETALIRDNAADSDDYNTAWTMVLLRGVVLAAILAVTAPLAADFFGDPRIQNVLYALSAIAVFDGLKNIGIVDFQKRLEFDKEFRFRLYRKVVAFVVTVSSAAIIMNYWALVIGIAAGGLAALISSYTMSEFRPRLSLKRLRKLFSFSIWLFFGNAGLYIRNNADRGVVGRFLDAGTLGLFTVAKELAELPSSELVAPIQAALLPGFAQISHDQRALSRAYVRTFSTILMIAGPVGVGMILLAEPFVLLALGQKWQAAAPILQILAIYGTVRVLFASSYAVFLALGRPRITAYLTFSELIYSIPLLVVGAQLYGLAGVAWATVLSTSISAPLAIFIVSRLLGLGLGYLWRAVWRSALSLAAMSGAVLYALDLFASLAGVWGHPAILLITGTIVGGATYVAAHLALWHASGRPQSAEAEVLTIAHNFGRRPSAGASA